VVSVGSRLSLRAVLPDVFQNTEINFTFPFVLLHR
jgi:hypothetical protein